jgi:hypothetical protein
LAKHVAKAILLGNCLQLYQYKYGWIGACDCLVESGQSDGITARTADPKAQPAFFVRVTSTPSAQEPLWTLLFARKTP